ncbi:TRAP transporter substrate-binding protein [Planococcus sp. CPCC 101016]|uniref:TRAP transporter substrate-binding protein n=1 Tax=Planococcus sp. CPCC 101016 TaxID=2599617 RepID=UPI0021BDC65F|nr:TRAP transporter substrate-binding protein [Planococcus sp. CPCC 101016]
MGLNKLRTLAVGISLGALLLSGCGNSEDTAGSGSDGAAGEFPEMTITFSHNQPLESPEHVGAEKFKEIVEGESDGKITVEVYPASQLGSLREQVESTQIGEIDITMQPSAVVSPFVDDVKLIDLPYLWPKEAEEKYRVLDSEVGDEVLSTLESGGFEGLGFWPGGYKLFTTQNTPIKSPEDLQGLTMRVMESPLLIEQYKTWGANAIPVPYAEVYNSLQQGVVDGQENPLQTIFLNNYHEVQNNIIEGYHGTMTYLLMANQGWFDGLSDEVKELILQAEEEGKQAARTALSETEEDYRQQIIDSGVEYYELTDAEIEKFREVSEPFHEEVYNTPEQLELLKKVKEEIEKGAN